MSCQVEQYADCGDISSLGRALFISDKEDNNWLAECCVSLSACGTLLAVGNKYRLCLLTSQWISVSETNSYLISWSGTLPYEVTALLVLSICPSQQSSQNGPDWFCVVVGFSNGHIGFYTNTGHLLLLEKLDESPVLKITCHTGTYGTLPDDIHILFQNCECIISGSSLFQILRDAKAQRAKVQAGVQDSYTVDSRSIAIRKWYFTDQDTINDAGVVGLDLKNTYDHLLAASTYGGYDVWYRSIPPVHTLILTAGTKPYIGFHYALEGGTTPPLQDVARAVANKIKSALPNWLGGGSGSSEQLAASEPTLREEALSLRAALRDAARGGARVVVSPDRRLAAVTDSLGRLAVLDIHRGHVIRMFKGCREAQCSFLQVFEEEDRKPHVSIIKELRRAIFLIIYNPKKGLIDIRLMQRGNRVAVFTATKNGILLYNTCGLVGTEKSYTHKKINVPEFQCVLLDPDGKLKKISVPFFFALEGEHSEKSKDLHVLRELREIIKSSDKTEHFQEAILEKASKLKTLQLKKHCIDMLIRNYEISPKVIVSCLNIFWNESLANDTSSNGEVIKKFFLDLCLLTQFYRRINNENTDDMQELIHKMKGSEEDLNTSLDHMLEGSDKKENINYELLEDDSCILERLLILSQEVKYKDHFHARVTFVDSKASTYKEFTSSFVSASDKSYLVIKPDLSTDKLCKLGSEIFNLILKMKDLAKLQRYVHDSNIDPKEIVRLMINYFMNMPLENFCIEIINKFIEILYNISLVKNEGTVIKYNEISPWWQEIRDMLVDMPCPLRSMSLAMACKAVSKIIETKCSEADDDAWETVSKENAKWGLLIGKLEDISILSIILVFKDQFHGTTLPKLELTEININLKYIYTRGKGSVTELIAMWLCSMGIPPEALITNELIALRGDEGTELSTPDDDGNPEYLFIVNNREYVDKNPKIFKWISLLRRQFPLSTATDYIIANMAWEYATSWQKNMQQSEYLAAVVRCLENIANLRLRHGLYCIIWSIIKPELEACCRLVNKVGKMPKEPLCLQDVHLDTENMLGFLKYSSTFLNQFFECATTPKCIEIQAIQFEKIWDESTPCLVEVAQDKVDVDNTILTLNHQICCTVYYHCHFNFKFSKPLDVLYDIDYQYVLAALTSHSLDKQVNANCSERVKQPRHNFLTKLIRHAIDTVICDEEEGQEKIYNTRECDFWINNIKQLAQSWNVDQDLINRQQVIGFYHLGYDTIAEHLVGLLKNPQLLLTPIIAITTQRLKRSLEHSRNQPEWIVTVAPQIYKRLQNTIMDASIPSHPSLRTTELVLLKILHEIDEKCTDSTNLTQDINLMQLLMETCNVLMRRKL